MTKLKMFVSALPLLFALAANSASASSFYDPDGGNTGACAAAHYENTDDSGYRAIFSIPAMENNAMVTVYGWVYDSNGNLAYQTSDMFSCSDGTIDGVWGYETDYSYSWW